MALLTSLVLLASPALARGGVAELHVRDIAVISSGQGGFGGGAAGDLDTFGVGVAHLGDVDGDGVDDLAVGEPGDDGDGGDRRGALWILLLNADGTVKAEQKIAEGVGGFTGPLDDVAFFGLALAGVGDLDGDGVPDLAAGARGAVGGGEVWILFLNADGTVAAQQRIADGVGGGPVAIQSWTQFGRSLAALGDLDGDGTEDLAVGSDDESVWILFLEPDGTVGSHVRHTDQHGSWFGHSLATLGDVDGDGVVDLAVGVPSFGSIDGGARILFLHPGGTAHSTVDIGPGAGSLPHCPQMESNDWLLGAFAAGPGDLNGDGVPDLVLGSPQHGPQGGPPSELERGGLWLLYLEPDGTIAEFTEIDESNGGVRFQLGNGVMNAVAGIGDRDGDGWADLALGTVGYVDSGPSAGAVELLHLAPGPAPAAPTIGTTYCSPAVPNSTGAPGRLLVIGDTDLAQNELYLRAEDLPPGSNLGYFLMGTGTDVFTPPTAAGPICVTPGLRRLLPSARNTQDLCGGFDRLLHTGGQLFIPVTPGSTWNFQAWHRDGAGLSNFTDAVSVDFR